MSRRRWLIGLFALLAFAQTLAYYVYLLNDPGNYNGAGAQGDQVAYIGLAQQLLQGGWSGAMHYMPGLPTVIAASQLVFKKSFITSSISVMRPFFRTISLNSRASTGIGKRLG